MSPSVEETVIQIIHSHRNDSDVYFGFPPEINKDGILYQYGASDELEEMVSEINEAFGINLEDEIGEMTVRSLIEKVKKCKSKREANLL